MATEAADFIGQLDQARPGGGESLGEADDHLRLLKECITKSFPGDGAGDLWDTALVVGPRYLNSLLNDFTPGEYVTKGGAQTITGEKTFTTPQQFNTQIQDLDGDHLASGTDTAQYFGYWNKPTYLLSPGKNDLKHGYGTDVASSATVLTTANIADHVVDLICGINQVIYTEDNVNPETRLPGTSFKRIAEGRFIVGVGAGTDENGKVRQALAGENAGIFEKTLTVNEMPAHDHDIRGTNVDRYGTGTTGYSVGQGSSTKSGGRGGSQAFSTAPPSYGLYAWKRES